MKRILALTAVAVLGLSAVSLAAPSRHKSTVKHTQGVVYAGITHTVGSDLYVAGDFKDTVLGRGAIVYLTKVSAGPQPGSVVVKAKQITVYTTHGSLRGTGKATQTLNSDGTATISDGTFDLTKGTGAYKGHKFSGTFSGKFKTNGVYKFTYKAKYK